MSMRGRHFRIIELRARDKQKYTIYFDITELWESEKLDID
jgi:hypothetical protein